LEDTLNDEGFSISTSEAPSDEHLKAIGRFVVTFAKFEENVSIHMSLLLGAEPELVSTLAYSLDIRNRCIALRGICAYRLGSADKIRAGENLKKDMQFKQLDKLFKSVQAAIEKRNRIVHSTWSKAPETASAHRLRWTKTKQILGWPEADYALVSVKDIETDIEFIDKVDKELWEYVWHNFGSWIKQRATGNNEDVPDS